jgi:mitochondrial fission protein ELM1
VIGAFLALSETVFVTEESASMVSEAVASGKSVVALKPQVNKSVNEYNQILEKFTQRGLLKCQDITLLDETEYFALHINNLEYTSTEEIKEKLKRYMDIGKN